MSPSPNVVTIPSSSYQVEPVSISWNPLALAQISGPQGVLLDSGAGYGLLSQFSFFGCEPFLICSAHGTSLDIVRGDQHQVFEGNPIKALTKLLEKEYIKDRQPVINPACKLPFQTGAAMGFLSYELNRFIESFPRQSKEDLGMPDLYFCFFDALLAHDHNSGQTWAIFKNERDSKKRLQVTLDKVQKNNQIVFPAIQPQLPSDLSNTSWESTFNFDDYSDAVKQAQSKISAGEIYQVNLSQCLWTSCRKPAYEVYQKFRSSGPSPFAAYIEGEDWAVLSLSPERFLRYLPKNRTIETRPIKGTRPRGVTKEEEKKMQQELFHSSKDAAEHIMIVDLERNDIGRIADYGTVYVSNLRCLESFPTVHHLTSTIVGKLKANQNLTGLLSATFPGGSITGAPKVRAMQIIDQLEPNLRGVYSGSIGYLAFDRSIDLNIAIRTLILKGGWATYSAGGAIVADSKIEDEYVETFHKASPFLKTFGLKYPPDFVDTTN
mgnify:CR=1 FL=1